MGSRSRSSLRKYRFLYACLLRITKIVRSGPERYAEASGVVSALGQALFFLECVHGCMIVEPGGRLHNAFVRRCERALVHLDANAVSAIFFRGQVRGSRTHERVEHRVSNEAEHANEPFGQFKGERGRVISGRSTGPSMPYLAEPSAMFFLRNYTQHPGGPLRGFGSRRVFFP